MHIPLQQKDRTHFKHLFVKAFSFIFFIIFSYCWTNLQITHMEMIKGIKGHGYYDELVIPIIENTAYEYELTESLAKAVCAFTFH